MSDLAGSAHAPLANTDGGKCLLTDLFRLRERYVRCVVTRGTANAVIDGVIALQYSACPAGYARCHSKDLEAFDLTRRGLA
jgi:hypothetical protein